jgi:hypothetical protein
MRGLLVSALDDDESGPPKAAASFEGIIRPRLSLAGSPLQAMQSHPSAATIIGAVRASVWRLPVSLACRAICPSTPLAREVATLSRPRSGNKHCRPAAAPPGPLVGVDEPQAAVQTTGSQKMGIESILSL